MCGRKGSNTQKILNPLPFKPATLLLSDLYCPVDIKAVKVSSKIGKMSKKLVPEVVLDLFTWLHNYVIRPLFFELCSKCRDLVDYCPLVAFDS